MTSKLIVNNIEADAGVSTITFGSEISASTFTGNLTGNVTGNVTSSSTSTFSSGLNVTGGSVGIGTDNPQDTLDVASAVPQIRLTDLSDGSYGQVRANGGNLILRADEGNTVAGSVILAEIDGDEKVRIDSGGRLRVGNTNENADGAFDDVIVGDHSGNRGISILSGPTSQGALGFAKSGTLADGYVAYNHNATATDSSMVIKSSGTIQFNAASVEKLRITSGGNVQIANGNLVFSTSGTGIDFSATADGSGTTSSEILDDYEEGTWTPVLGGTTTLGTTANGTGNYVKIGQLVHIEVRFSNVTISGGSGSIQITGLPFTRIGSPTTDPPTMVMTYLVSFDTTGIPTFYIDNTRLYGLVSRNGQTWVDWSYSNWTTSGIYLSLVGSYRANA